MKLNWAERWVVNNPVRVMEQRRLLRWLQKALPLRVGANILEVGCGRGAGAALIQEHFRPAKLHAEDLDEKMIRKAKKFLSPRQRAGIFLYVGDVCHLPYRPAVMDAVFCFGVLHHVPHWQAALEELARVLKPGGVLYLEELYPAVYQNFLTRHLLLHPRENRFGSKELHAALREMRFEVHAAREHRAVGILTAAIRGN